MRNTGGVEAGNAQQRVGGGNDGLPFRLAELGRIRESWLDGTWEDGIPRVTTGEKNRVQKLKALGNAVVPQVVEEIGRAIMEAA